MTPEGGLGFCHSALPSLLPSSYHGPLVVALDSNILIDLQVHGATLLNGASLPSNVKADQGYSRDLSGLTHLINLWLIRDIRFVVTPRSKTDTRRGVTQSFLDRRLPTVDSLAASLAFQFGDWNAPVPSDGADIAPIGTETGLPPGADRDLVIEAQAISAHVFLTRDTLILKHARLSGPNMAIFPPAALAQELTTAGIQLFLGGTCDDSECPYNGWPVPAPDIGKWTGLLAIFDQD